MLQPIVTRNPPACHCHAAHAQHDGIAGTRTVKKCLLLASHAAPSHSQPDTDMSCDGRAQQSSFNLASRILGDGLGCLSTVNRLMPGCASRKPNRMSWTGLDWTLFCWSRLGCGVGFMLLVVYDGWRRLVSLYRQPASHSPIVSQDASIRIDVSVDLTAGCPSLSA